MPPRRGYNGYNKRYAYKNRQPYSASSKADKALRMVTELKKEVSPEKKSILTPLAATSTTTAVITNMTAIAQGNDLDARTANKIKMWSIRAQGTLLMSGAGTASRARLVLFRDNNGSTTLPVIGDIWADSATFTAGRPRRNDPQNMSRFTVLYDEMFLMSDNGQQHARVDMYRRISSAVYFSGTAATDEGKGHLYFIQGSNEGTNLVGTSVGVITRYIDN